MQAASVRRIHLPGREVMARVALAFLIAFVPASAQSGPLGSAVPGHPDGGAVVLAVGNWPDPM